MHKLTFQFGSQFKVKHTVQPSTGPVMAAPIRPIIRGGMSRTSAVPTFGKRPPEKTWALRRSCTEWSIAPEKTKRSA